MLLRVASADIGHLTHIDAAPALDAAPECRAQGRGPRTAPIRDCLGRTEPIRSFGAHGGAANSARSRAAAGVLAAARPGIAATRFAAASAPAITATTVSTGTDGSGMTLIWRANKSP